VISRMTGKRKRSIIEINVGSRKEHFTGIPADTGVM
jgi:hypothetical protein